MRLCRRLRRCRSLLQTAIQQLQHGDMDAATYTLDKVKAKNPDQRVSVEHVRRDCSGETELHGG